jgi:hypothetical protein
MRLIVSRLQVASATALMLVPAAAQATRVYDTTTSPTTHTEAGFGAAPRLDDATLAGGVGPIVIRAMNFGYANLGSSSQNVDALVTFWDNVNINATGSTTVNSGNLGSFRRPIGPVAAGNTGTTGLFPLTTPISVPDTTVGVQIDFVLAGTNTPSEVAALLSSNLPTVGSTADKFWSDDQSPGGVFQGQDAVFYDGFSADHPNFYLALDTEPVPEPGTAAATVACGVVGLLRRRRA